MVIKIVVNNHKYNNNIHCSVFLVFESFESFQSSLVPITNCHIEKTNCSPTLNKEEPPDS